MDDVSDWSDKHNSLSIGCLLQEEVIIAVLFIVLYKYPEHRKSAIISQLFQPIKN